MKRIDAITHVIDKLKGLKESLNKGESVSPLEFLKLSEIFKFQIEPLENRFTAIILDEASKSNDDGEHLDMINAIIGSTIADETGDEESVEGEIDELVDYDGSIMSNKIPYGSQTNQTIGTSKTTDDVVKATSQYGVWSSGGNFFKRYYGESVEELGEVDKTGVLGVEETDQLDFDGAVKYYEDELEIPKDEAIERVEKERGPESLEKTKTDDAFTRHRLTEKERLIKISEDKAKDMLEILLSDKSDSGEITSSERLLKKKVADLIKLAHANNLSVEDLRDMI